MIKTLLLILILLLAFFMAFIPHIGYAYPLHLDEWMHLAFSTSVAETGSVSFPDPFSGLGTMVPGSNAELGYHVLLGLLQQVSGIDWLIFFRVFPSLIFMLTVLAVYILCRKDGYGLEAAFFTCLIPTTVGLMGPAFMVPVALGLTFIPLTLFLAFRVKSWPSYMLLFIITCFMWMLHPPTAVVLYIVLFPFILINIKENPRHSVCIFLAIVAPLIIYLPWLLKRILSEVSLLMKPQIIPLYVEVPALLWIYGILPIIFGFLGVIFLVKKGGKNNYGLIFGCALLLIVGLVLVRFQYGMYTIYARGLLTTLLLLGIVAGAGLFWVRNLALPAPVKVSYKSIFSRNLGNSMIAISVVVILAIAVPTRLNAAYYHMIDDQDYQSFVWIRENSAADNYCSVLDPWKATAFTAITGKNVLRQITIMQKTADDMVYGFLSNGCQDISFLRENKATLIYNRLPCDNKDLAEVRNNIFIVDPDISSDYSSSVILKNASFEAVTGEPPAYWFSWSQNCNPAFLFPELGRNGGSCVGIVLDEAGSVKMRPIARWVQNVPVQAGTSYIIGGWIKARNIEGQDGASIFIQWFDSSGNFISYSTVVAYLKGTSDWIYEEVRIIAPVGTVKGTILLNLAGCTGTAWFDDITFKAE